MKQVISITFITLGLTACGGGDGGSSSSTPSSPAEQESSAADTQQPTILTTQQLSVPDGFDYDPSLVINSNIDISAFSTQRAYASLYRRYSAGEDQQWIADYSSRIASASLNEGKAKLEVTYGGEVESLLLEIWFYDGTPPLQKILSEAQTDFIY